MFNDCMELDFAEDQNKSCSLRGKSDSEVQCFYTLLVLAISLSDPEDKCFNGFYHQLNVAIRFRKSFSLSFLCMLKQDLWKYMKWD